MLPSVRLICLLLALCGAGAGAVAQAVVLPIPAPRDKREISVTVTPGLTRTAKLPAEPLRAARRALIAGEPVTPVDLRALADHGDGLAALKYTRILVQAGDSDPSDIAYYGSMAAATGRIWALADAVAAMHRLDPATEPEARIKTYAAMLYPHAWAGNALALDALIDLNGPGRLFGPLSEATRVRIVEQDRLNGDGRAVLRMALHLLQAPTRSPAETALVHDYLAQAQAGDNPAVQATATALLAQLAAAS